MVESTATTTTTSEQGNPKLVKMRAQMEERGLSAFVCFHMDQHNSEYIAACDERIAYISGFDGSNGIVVVTKNDARMWTDGRYYIQAVGQLEEGFTMMKMERGTQNWFDWTSSQLAEGDCIGVDFSQYPAANLQSRIKYFEGKKMEVKETENLVDLVWDDERPPRPENPVKVLDIEFSGRESLDKQNDIRRECIGKDFQMLLVNSLDDICWLTNLRGTDIDYNPVFFSYVLFKPVGQDQKPEVTLFVNSQKVEGIKDYLESQRIKVKEYHEITEELKAIAESGDIKIGVHKDTCNAQIFNIIEKIAVNTEKNIIQHFKAAKNATEQQGMRAANVRDCAAIFKYFAFLESELKKEDHELTEFSGARIMDDLRTKGKYHQGPSFDTISSIGANGAVIHYKPTEDKCNKLNADEIYLLDSGGQYLDGTTDITRSVHFNGAPPTQFQKEAYTRVLLGVLDLERLVWPAGVNISGADMDVLARKNLWEVGLDFKHGTGHGVGSYLNVHEGPVGVSRMAKTQFVVGHCVSNEPGYYEDGQFGIRIENVIMCQPHPTYERHLMWENLTVAPYCRDLIEKDLLSPRTIRYIDEFHQRCLKELTPLLEDDELALDYLKRACEPL